MNSCPEHPCSAYVQPPPAPVCVSPGECLVTSEFTNLAIVISLPQDSPFAPERTFAFPYAQVLGMSAPSGQTCPTARCAWLPGIADITGSFIIPPDVEQEVGWYLNPPGINTWLPVQPTYRLLWPSPAGHGVVDAASLGLPIADVTGTVATASVPPGSVPPGPNGGPSPVFQEFNLPPLLPGSGLAYELTLMPVPPLDRAFPPDVMVVDTLPSGVQTPSITLQALDSTQGTDPAGKTTIPTFDITRNERLDGWTAYLRDATTLRRISNVAQLSGITTPGVQLATDHHPLPTQECQGGMGPDALANAQLVVAPPRGQPIPTYVASSHPTCQIPRAVAYPSLPPAVPIRGTVVASDGTALAAQLVFDSMTLDAFSPTRELEHYDVLHYTATASASIDDGGSAAYAITLPQGQYRLTIRPLDTTAAVTIVRPFIVVPPNPPAGDPAPSSPDVTALPLQFVQGFASVADNRPLTGATIDAVPVKCFDGTASPSCMPRAAQAITAADGSYAFGPGGGPPGLDPGSYVLRARPADGSRLPWVWQAIVVGPSPVVPSTFVVPAPVYAGMTVLDAASPPNPVINAVVRMFAIQPQGPAVEVGRALTDTSGYYDMYLAPQAPASP